MKAETQADNLALLVEKKRPFAKYELALPLFKIRQRDLKKLQVDDVLLVGLSKLELCLLFEGKICANVEFFAEESYENIKIAYLQKDTMKSEDTKKYETLKCSFGMLKSRRLEVGHKISIAQLDLHEVALFVNDKNIAAGRLINVDDEIAIEIIKVKK